MMGRVYQSRTLRSVLQDHDAQLRKVGSASILARSGLSVPAEGVTAVDGDLQAESFAAGSAGWRLQAGGNAEFNDVTLRGILVGLDTPVRQDVARDTSSGFTLTTTFTERAGLDVVVPEGCTRVNATIFGRMYVVNPNSSGGSDGTGADAIYVQAGIDGQFSTATPLGISGSNGFATTITFDAFEITGLTPGATVRVSAQVKSRWATMLANPDDFCSVVGQLTWLR